jgi:hypothetical protein
MKILSTQFARLKTAFRAYIDVLTLAGAFSLDAERSKS